MNQDAIEDQRPKVTDDDLDGYNEMQGDCDDADQAVSPDGTESCNGVDDDCDGDVDETDGLVDDPWYADADGDGFGAGGGVVTCTPPEGFVQDGSDCDDTDADRFPGAVEACNGADDDCDGVADGADEVEKPAWYADADGDGYGSGDAVLSCEDPGGSARADGDCDEEDPAVNPGAVETCNGIDDDCNGVSDDADAITWYLDRDGDGYGDDGTTWVVCEPPPGYAEIGGDCDDDDTTRHPGAEEVCENGFDDNCDGAIEATCGLGAGELAASDMSARWSVGYSETYVARSVTSAGDLDGDGDDELLVARPGYGDFAGAVSLVAGGADLMLGDRDLDADGVLVVGTTAVGAFGYAVATGEDVSGDGVDDLLVGAIEEDRVYLFTDGAALLSGAADSASADLVLVGLDGTGSFGSALALLGDLDGDGFGDWVVGDPEHAGTGAAWLFYGDGTGGGAEIRPDDPSVVQLSTDREDARLGRVTSAAGDLDGDGAADFVVADATLLPSEDTYYAYVYVGMTSRMVGGDVSDAPLIVSQYAAEVPFADVVALGDVNGDGHDDLGITATGHGDGAGSVVVALGASVLPTSETLDTFGAAAWIGSSGEVGLGASLGGPGDVTGDGLADLASSPARTSAAAGTLYVFAGDAALSGTFSELDAWVTVSGGTTDAEGDAVARRLDFNGDSAADLFFSAWDSATTQSQGWLAYGSP